MGRMKAIYTERQEWADTLAMVLDERVELLETDHPIEWWALRLHDGIVISKVADSHYVEPAGDPAAAVEYDPLKPEERDATIAAFRSNRNTQNRENGN